MSKRAELRASYFRLLNEAAAASISSSWIISHSLRIRICIFLPIFVLFFISFYLSLSLSLLFHYHIPSRHYSPPNPFPPLPALCLPIFTDPSRPSPAPLLCCIASPSLSLSIGIGKAARGIFYAQPNGCSHSYVPTDNINQPFFGVLLIAFKSSLKFLIQLLIRGNLILDL